MILISGCSWSALRRHRGCWAPPHVASSFFARGIFHLLPLHLQRLMHVRLSVLPMSIFVALHYW